MFPCRGRKKVELKVISDFQSTQNGGHSESAAKGELYQNNITDRFSDNDSVYKSH